MIRQRIFNFRINVMEYNPRFLLFNPANIRLKRHHIRGTLSTCGEYVGGALLSLAQRVASIVFFQSTTLGVRHVVGKAALDEIAKAFDAEMACLAYGELRVMV